MEPNLLGDQHALLHARNCGNSLLQAGLRPLVYSNGHDSIPTLVGTGHLYTPIQRSGKQVMGPIFE